MSFLSKKITLDNVFRVYPVVFISLYKVYRKFLGAKVSEFISNEMNIFARTSIWLKIHATLLDIKGIPSKVKLAQKVPSNAATEFPLCFPYIHLSSAVGTDFR